MSAGMNASRTFKASCSCRLPEHQRQHAPVLSVVDLTAFKHDSSVEENLLSFPHESAPSQDPQEDDDLVSTTTKDSSACPSLESRDSTVSSSSSTHDELDTRQLTTSVQVPKFVDVCPEPSRPSNSHVLRALHQFRADLSVMEISAVDCHESLRVTSVELSPTVPPRGHVDGGPLPLQRIARTVHGHIDRMPKKNSVLFHAFVSLMTLRMHQLELGTFAHHSPIPKVTSSSSPAVPRKFRPLSFRLMPSAKP